ncbi:MAG TPA: hypothetical protein VMU14_02410 [Acidimicrobiales bacterium]|nr:hypothetical protein [Acidimicrobiales bacterium]
MSTTAGTAALAEEAAATRLPATSPRRRFTLAAAVGVAVAALPALWLLTDDWWGRLIGDRQLGPDDFFDLQAKAIMHGHLWVPKDPLGVEAFVHGGHAYTYFGIFPSLLRIPVLAVLPRASGYLTVPSMLLAWAALAVGTCLLIWRVRVMIRGDALLGRTEAASLGALVAAVMGGSVVAFIAAAPWVYDEDLVWSMALSVLTLFVLAGIVERPSHRRVVAAGVLMLAGNLSRAPTAWACVAGAVLVAGWFWLGRPEADRRRWALPVLVAALVPFAVGCAVNMAKFGTPVGFNFAEQVWTQRNAHRRAFLAANRGKGWSPAFLPTTLSAYLDPFGIRWESTFPFVTMPAAPPSVVGNAVFDRVYRTASIPAAMPLLTLLSLWGALSVLRRRAMAGARLLRPVMLAALLAPCFVLVWGYIAPRFEADFVPLLVLGSAVGMVDLWRRADGMRRRWRLTLAGTVALLTAYGLVANTGIALTPTQDFNQIQAFNFVHAVKSWSDVTGGALKGRVAQGATLPTWAPADQIFVVGDCAGLYVSNGEDYSTIPEQQYERAVWDPVEFGPGYYNEAKVRFGGPDTGAGVPVLTVGGDTVALRPDGAGHFRVVLDDPVHPHAGKLLARPPGAGAHSLVLEVDPSQHRVLVFFDTVTVALDAPLYAAGPAGAPVVMHTTVPGTAFAGVTPVVLRPPAMPLCHRLLADR